jgi:hypothetical protein
MTDFRKFQTLALIEHVEQRPDALGLGVEVVAMALAGVLAGLAFRAAAQRDHDLFVGWRSTHCCPS